MLLKWLPKWFPIETGTCLFEYVYIWMDCGKRFLLRFFSEYQFYLSNLRAICFQQTKNSSRLRQLRLCYCQTYIKLELEARLMQCNTSLMLETFITEEFIIKSTKGLINYNQTSNLTQPTQFASHFLANLNVYCLCYKCMQMSSRHWYALFCSR